MCAEYVPCLCVCMCNTGLEIVPGGIVLQVDGAENSTGVAFVEFSTKEDAERALERDRHEIDHRSVDQDIFCINMSSWWLCFCY